MTTEREIMRLTDAIKRVMDRYLEVWHEPPEDLWAAFEAKRLHAECDRLVECLIEARPDTVHGILLKVRTTWLPADSKDHLQAIGSRRRVLMSALADLERFRRMLDTHRRGAL